MHQLPKALCVLVVDDEPDIRRILYEALRAAGATVWVAPDGAEATTILRAHSDEINIALVDLRLPTMDGFATVAALRALQPGLPCLLVTGMAEVPEAAFIASGAVGVLPKPFSLDTLYRAVTNLAGAPVATDANDACEQ